MAAGTCTDLPQVLNTMDYVVSSTLHIRLHIVNSLSLVLYHHCNILANVMKVFNVSEELVTFSAVYAHSTQPTEKHHPSYPHIPPHPSHTPHPLVGLPMKLLQLLIPLS